MEVQVYQLVNKQHTRKTYPIHTLILFLNVSASCRRMSSSFILPDAYIGVYTDDGCVGLLLVILKRLIMVLMMRMVLETEYVNGMCLQSSSLPPLMSLEEGMQVTVDSLAFNLLSLDFFVVTAGGVRMDAVQPEEGDECGRQD